LKLWHQHLIRYLPTRMLTDLHSSCCALRSSRSLDIKLSAYHLLVLDELERRCKTVSDSSVWRCHNYCGKKRGYVRPYDRSLQQLYLPARDEGRLIYAEHDNSWMLRCLRSLKNIELVGTSVEELTLKAEIDGGCV